MESSLYPPLDTTPNDISTHTIASLVPPTSDNTATAEMDAVKKMELLGFKSEDAQEIFENGITLEEVQEIIAEWYYMGQVDPMDPPVAKWSRLSTPSKKPAPEDIRKMEQLGFKPEDAYEILVNGLRVEEVQEVLAEFFHIDQGGHRDLPVGTSPRLLATPKKSSS